GSEQPLTGGTAAVSGPASVQAGDEFEFDVGLSELNGRFTALNVIVEYDPDVLTFDTVTNGSSVSLAESALELLQPNFTAVSAVNEAQGKLRLILFTLDEQHAISNIGPLFKLQATVQ